MDYLTQRGKVVEALFGFRRGATMAVIPWSGLVLEKVALDPDRDGAIRCRLAGEASTLVRVTDELWLNVTKLALIWPFVTSELLRRTDARRARELLGVAPMLERLSRDRLRELIVEHQIRAEDLHVLGDGPRVHEALDGELRFALRFDAGTLELEYTRDAYRRAHIEQENPFVTPALDVTARWNGTRIELFGDLEWHDAELAELAVLANMMLPEQPQKVLELIEAAFDDDTDPLAADDELHVTILNLWGVALRRVGRLEDAVDKLTDALAIIRSKSDPLEQQVAYNRGYARLQSTMKSRLGRDGAGMALFTSNFLLEERHRETWLSCLRDFERARELDPKDPTAISQVALTRRLLELLDHGPPKAGSGSSPVRKAKESAKEEKKSEKDSLLWGWLIPFAVIGAIFAAAALRAHSERTGRPPFAPPPIASASPPSAEDVSEQLRERLFDFAEPSALMPAAGEGPCAVSVLPPREVPPGEVVAPHLDRAIGTGELYGTEHFDATVHNYLRLFAPHAEARPSVASGVGPLLGVGEHGPGTWMPRGGHRLTVLVTAWRDPVILEGGASMLPGTVAARLLLWSYEESRFVCVGEVSTENGPGLRVVRNDPLAAPYGSAVAPGDDPLNRARLDLIEQALRRGIPRLVTTLPP